MAVIGEKVYSSRARSRAGNSNPGTRDEQLEVIQREAKHSIIRFRIWCSNEKIQYGMDAVPRTTALPLRVFMTPEEQCESRVYSSRNEG